MQEKEPSFIESASNKCSLQCLMWATSCMQQEVTLFEFNAVFLAHVLAMMSQTESVVVAVACHGLYLYLELMSQTLCGGSNGRSGGGGDLC
jgi:hypothetical protein